MLFPDLLEPVTITETHFKAALNEMPVVLTKIMLTSGG